MWLSNSYLKQCEELLAAGYRPVPSAGMVLTRGFADIGNEPFCVLAGGGLVSLLSGERSDPGENDRAHLAHVPRCDEVVEQLLARGVTIESLFFEEQRDWV